MGGFAYFRRRLFQNLLSMNRVTITAMAFLFSLTCLLAGQEDDWFQQANAAFEADDFDKAIGLYQQISGLGYESAELEHNLGNAYFRKKEVGEAILVF